MKNLSTDIMISAKLFWALNKECVWSDPELGYNDVISVGLCSFCQLLFILLFSLIFHYTTQLNVVAF